MKPEPLFIFSQPRAGSTLLQKMLMAHPEMESIAEPWLLLPMLYATKADGLMAEYNQEASSQAISEFVESLPNKQDDYLAAIADWAQGLYEKGCKGRPVYFIDKSPRYYLVLPEIIRAFPAAKFIFLFRNPLSVYSSILKTWCQGRFLYQHTFMQDINTAPVLLVEALNSISEDRRLHVNYEQLVLAPEQVLSDICEYLGLGYTEQMLKQYSVQDLRGSLGDKWGNKQYSGVASASIEKWITSFDSWYRVKVAQAYIERLGDDTLSAMGYSKNKLLGELKVEATHKIGIRDMLDYVISECFRRLNGEFFVRMWKDRNSTDKKLKYRIYK
ncbi:sulfotransferase [Oceanicoccus sp. KOV_DT_Chl]|uniref:sulfotransferase family protein n=1 Tax=Oceanicoccus sp. KOV_DT_Chl TaxID=1904639 RepID=UPI000C7E44DC|nr:sulfotransferase [Oceanicoccus sp. KOV_DT_Chl]